MALRSDGGTLKLSGRPWWDANATAKTAELVARSGEASARGMQMFGQGIANGLLTIGANRQKDRQRKHEENMLKARMKGQSDLADKRNTYQLGYLKQQDKDVRKRAADSKVAAFDAYKAKIEWRVGFDAGHQKNAERDAALKAEGEAATLRSHLAGQIGDMQAQQKHGESATQMFRQAQEGQAAWAKQMADYRALGIDDMLDLPLEQMEREGGRAYETARDTVMNNVLSDVKLLQQTAPIVEQLRSRLLLIRKDEDKTKTMDALRIHNMLTRTKLGALQVIGQDHERSRARRDAAISRQNDQEDYLWKKGVDTRSKMALKGMDDRGDYREKVVGEIYEQIQLYEEANEGRPIDEAGLKRLLDGMGVPSEGFDTQQERLASLGPADPGVRTDAMRSRLKIAQRKEKEVTSAAVRSLKETIRSMRGPGGVFITEVAPGKQLALATQGYTSGLRDLPPDAEVPPNLRDKAVAIMMTGKAVVEPQSPLEKVPNDHAKAYFGQWVKMVDREFRIRAQEQGITEDPTKLQALWGETQEDMKERFGITNDEVWKGWLKLWYMEQPGNTHFHPLHPARGK